MYKVLYAESAEELEAKINENAADGWRPISTSVAAGPRSVIAVTVMWSRNPHAPNEPVRYKDVPAPSSA